MKLLKLFILIIGASLLFSSPLLSQFNVKLKVTPPDVKVPDNKKDVEKKVESNKDGGYDQFLTDMGDIANSFKWDMGKLSQSKRIDMAKKLNLTETAKRIGIQGMGSTFMTETAAKNILWLKDDRTKYYSGQFKTDINTMMDDAYKLKGNGEMYKAIKTAKKMEDEIDFGLALFPGNPNVTEVKPDADKTFNELAGPYYAKVWSSDFHKANAGKILFSNKPIIPGKEDPVQFATSFTANDRIYAIAYADAIFKDFLTINYAEFKINIDKKCGDQKEGCERIGTDLDYKETWENGYYITEILPDPSQALRIDDAKGWAKVLSGLSPRKHNIDVYFENLGPRVAEGSFALDLSGFSSEKMNADAESAASQAVNNKAKNTPLPEIFNSPLKGFKDKALTQDKMKKIIQGTLDEGRTVVKVAVNDIYDDEWSVRKNDYGIITDRTTSSTVSVLIKDTEGWCWYLLTCYFEETYEGGGYGSPFIVGSWNWVKCNCGDK